ncbi:hypothetical protein CspeluHIS016_0102490 [Cutaneotrichosporon spelunceum]|uniref:Uncharacterized protein n=1 Tax=Cutaneotrichosporon spelunceum TaxID=1672016 RepID=A0AAD3Y964_9TREE|nr:hypothetical protein CspeluHIS016_0102490 [Cutaneotrichosporon spelunceum]
MLPVNYTVQGHRYDIAETWGPMIPSVSTWPTLAIRFILPTLIACASLFYAGEAIAAAQLTTALSMRWFFVRRAQFRSILSGSGLTTGVYLRLLGLAVTDSILLMFGTVFNTLFLLVFNRDELHPTASWDSIHSNFGLVSQFPEEFFNVATTLDVPFYLSVLYAMSVFAFFSFGEDAVGQYLKVWRFVKRLVTVSHRETVEIPTLGSTIVTLTGPAWEDDHRVSGGVVKNEGSSENCAAGPGIAVTIEHSVV